MEITINTDILIAIMPPLVATSIFVIRYFWRKEACFTRLRDKIEQLAEHDNASVDEHDGFDERLSAIENKQTEGMIYLKLVLKKLDIPYD